MKIARIRIPRPLGWTLGVSTVLIVAVGLFLAWFKWDMLRGPIAERASAASGRHIEIDGHLQVHPWSWTPTATFNDLRIGNPAWMHGGDVADVDRFTVAVKLWPLLFGQVELPLVEADHPKIQAYRDVNGQTNWSISSHPLRLPPIQHFVINNGRLTYLDRKRDLTVVGVMQSSESGGGRGAFHLIGDGTINKAPFLLTISGGPLINVRRDRPYPFDADIHAATTRVLAHGEINRPFDFGRMRADLTVSGRNFANLYDLTGLALPPTPPYRLAGELVRKDESYSFHNVVGRVGSSDVEGAFQLDRASGRPDLKADLRSRQLRLADLGALIGAPPPGPSKTPAQQADAARLASAGRVLPDAPINVSRFRSMDAVLHYRAASVVTRKNLPLRSFALELVLNHGVLTADPVAFSFPRGALTGKVRVDARPATPLTDLDVKVTNLRAEDFFHNRAQAPLEGLVEARAKLHGVGASVHQAASTANGAFTVVAPQGKIRQTLAELLGVNVIKGLGLYLANDRSETGVRCAVADFQATNGVLTARTLVLDTDPVIASGQGTIDLRTESVNLTLKGHPKHFQLIRLDSPVAVTGQLKSPHASLRPGNAPLQAAAAVALGAVLTPFAAILPFVDLGLAKNADCQNLIAQAHAEGAPVKVQSTAGSALQHAQPTTASDPAVQPAH